MEKQKNTCTEQGRSVPKLRFPEFNDNWSRIKLGQLSELITKGTTPNIFINSGINFIKIECFDGDIINKERCLFIDSKIHNGELRRSILEDGDILFAIAGATIGKCCIVTKEILPANTNQALSIIRLKNDNNRQFIYNVLKSHYMQKYIKDNISVGAQPNLNLEQMGNFSFKLPSLPEQQKIASFLTSVDERIAQLTKKKALLEQYKKGVMQKIFSQEIRFKIENEAGELVEPPKWEEMKLGEVANRITRKNKENNLNVLTISAQHGLINQEDFFKKSVSAKDLTGYYLLEKDDFAYNKSYSTGYPMGAIKRLKKYEKGVVSTLYICFKFQQQKVNFEFIEQYFESGLHNREIEQIAQEGARNHGLLNIGLSDFFNTQIQLPCIEEQTKIANFLSAIDKKIEGVAEVLEATRRWKKGLLQQMFC